MKTTIVCGLLGAGKTTFIRHFIRGVKGSERVVVLVNDFGNVGIDGEIFSADGIEAVELPSGCVCCALKFDLITTIEKIKKEFFPDHVLIEPSGVASASGVLDALNLLKISQVTVIGIVDATEFLELRRGEIYGAFFEDQIINSDVILVNKSDLADEEKIIKTIDLLSAINTGALIFRTVNCILDVHLESVSRSRLISPMQSPRINFETVSMRLSGPVSYSLLDTLFGELARGAFGDVVRAKALVQTDEGPFRFDLSYGQNESRPFERKIVESRIVLIGENLEKDILRSALGSCLRSGES